MLLCNATHTAAGIDWSDRDPEADFVQHDVECGKPARYGDRIHAGEFSNTLFCDDCFAELGREGQIDIWPLKEQP